MLPIGFIEAKEVLISFLLTLDHLHILLVLLLLSSLILNSVNESKLTKFDFVIVFILPNESKLIKFVFVIVFIVMSFVQIL